MQQSLLQLGCGCLLVQYDCLQEHHLVCEAVLGNTLAELHAIVLYKTEPSLLCCVVHCLN